MTREEFMATTDIKNPEEAKEYLKKLDKIGMMMPFLLIGGIALAVIFNKFERFFYINFIFVLPFFISIYKSDSLQIEIINKLNKQKTKFDRNFALFSRLGLLKKTIDFSHFRDSLEIIAGSKPVPENIEAFNSNFGISSVASIKDDKVFWKNAGFAFIISLIVFVIAIYLAK